MKYQGCYCFKKILHFASRFFLTWSSVAHALQSSPIITSQKHAALYRSEPLHRNLKGGYTDTDV